MALYDDPKKKRPLTALEQQAAATQADYGASVNRMNTAQKQATGIQIPAPIIQEGRGSFKSIARPGQDAAVTALRTLGGVARQEQAKQTAMIPTFNAQAAGLRAQAGADRATAANLGANKLLAGVGAAPIAAPVAAPRPAATPPAPGAIASPGVRFAGIDAAPDNFYRNPPGTKPRTAAELNQASQAEVNARTSTQPPAGTSQGAGAPSPVGGTAPNRLDPNTYTNGAGVTKRVPMPGTMEATKPAVGSVNAQNFGTAVVPQAPGSIARPAVASTYGLSVNDARLDDQRAIARPTLGPNQLAVSGTFRGPDAMAEQYNSREDREARNKQLGDIDTALFQLRGKNDPDSLRALTALTQTRAGLVGGGESLSADAVQGRANRDNAYGIADLNNAGENNRAGIQADVARAGQQVTREGQQLDYGAKLADIARPQLKQDANGNYINIAGNASTTVTDAQGNPVRGAQTEQAQQRDYGQENDNKMFTDLLATKIDQNGNPLPNAVDLAMADMQKYKAAQNQQTAQSASTAPTLDAYVKAARAAGYKQSDAELAAAFQKKYPQAK